jgi:hypothetical protein
MNVARLIKRSARTSIQKKPQAAFFQLPAEIELPEVEAPLPQSPTGYRFQIERPDGSLLTLTLPMILLRRPGGQSILNGRLNRCDRERALGRFSAGERASSV